MFIKVKNVNSSSFSPFKESMHCVEVEEGGIWIHNASEGTLCQVFSTDGKLLKLVKLTTVNHFIGLPGSQMYIVKVGDKTIKVAL